MFKPGSSVLPFSSTAMFPISRGIQPSVKPFSSNAREISIVASFLSGTLFRKARDRSTLGNTCQVRRRLESGEHRGLASTKPAQSRCFSLMPRIICLHLLPTRTRAYFHGAAIRTLDTRKERAETSRRWSWSRRRRKGKMIVKWKTRSSTRDRKGFLPNLNHRTCISVIPRTVQCFTVGYSGRAFPTA